MEAIFTLAIFQVDLKMLQSSIKYLEVVQKINSGRRLRLSTASGATCLKIFVMHEAATL